MFSIIVSEIDEEFCNHFQSTEVRGTAASDDQVSKKVSYQYHQHLLNSPRETFNTISAVLTYSKVSKPTNSSFQEFYITIRSRKTKKKKKSPSSASLPSSLEFLYGAALGATPL